MSGRIVPIFCVTALLALCCVAGGAPASAAGGKAAKNSERANYFEGKILSEAAFTREQEYNNKRCGPEEYGVVRGLEVAAGGGAGREITISPGIALTPEGKQVILPSVKGLKMPITDGKHYVMACEDLRARCCLLLAVIERRDGRVNFQRAGTRNYRKARPSVGGATGD